MRLETSTSLRDRLMVAALACTLAGTGLVASAPFAWGEEPASEGDGYVAEAEDPAGDYVPEQESTSTVAVHSLTRWDAEQYLSVEDFQSPTTTWISLNVTNNVQAAADLATQVNAARGDLGSLTSDPELESLAYTRAAECTLLNSDMRPNGTLFTTVGDRVIAEFVVAREADDSSDLAEAAAQIAAQTNGYTSMGCASVTAAGTDGTDGTTYWVILLASDGAVGEASTQVEDGEATYIFAVESACLQLTDTQYDAQIEVGGQAQLSLPGKTVASSVQYADLDYWATFTEANVNLCAGNWDFSWSTSNTGIATVQSGDDDQHGVLTGVSDGTCTVSMHSGVFNTDVIFALTVGTGENADAIDLGTDCKILGITDDSVAYYDEYGFLTAPSFSVVYTGTNEAGEQTYQTLDPTLYTVSVTESADVPGMAVLTVTANSESPRVVEDSFLTTNVGIVSESAEPATLELGNDEYLVASEGGEEGYPVAADENGEGAEGIENAGEGVENTEGAEGNAKAGETPEVVAATSLDQALVAAIANVTYTGAAQTPAVTVTMGEQVLVEGTDYTVAYSNNVNAGQASVTVTGIGAYTGTLTAGFTIDPQQLSGTFTVAKIESQTYTGEELYPAITVSDGTTTLVAGTDFSIAYEQNVNAGTAHVVVYGAGNYTGTIDGAFIITPLNIARATVTMPNVAYTGSPLTPVPASVTVGNLTLQEGTDYTVAGYTNNTNVGDAKATLQGKGNYTGTVVVNWKVVAQGTADAGTTQTLPQTGDTTNIVPVVVGVVVGVALVVAAVVLIARSRSSKKR